MESQGALYRSIHVLLCLLQRQRSVAYGTFEAAYVTTDRRNVLLHLCILRSCSLSGLLRLRSRGLHLIHPLLQILDLTVATLHLFHQMLDLLLLSLDCLLHFCQTNGHGLGTGLLALRAARWVTPLPSRESANHKAHGQCHSCLSHVYLSPILSCMSFSGDN